MLIKIVVMVGCCAYNRALYLLVCSPILAQRRSNYCLAVHVQVDLRVVGREDAVCGSDDRAGGHGALLGWKSVSCV